MVFEKIDRLRGRGRRRRLDDHGDAGDVGLVRDGRAALHHLVAPARHVIGGRRAGLVEVDALEPRPVRPVGQLDGARILPDERGHVERRPGHRAAVARGEITVVVVAVIGVLRARHRRDRMRAGKAIGADIAGAVGVGAGVGLRGDIAERVISHRHRCAARALARGRHRRGGHPVQAVIDEAFGDGLDTIAALEEIAERVKLIGQVLDGARSRARRRDRGQMPGGRVVAPRLGDAIAERVGGDIAAGVRARRLPVGGPGRGVQQLRELAVSGVGGLNGQPRRIADAGGRL